MVVKNLPAGIKEGVGWGMITYNVPFSVISETHNRRPLCYAGLAAQKNHYALYLMNVYVDPSTLKWMTKEFKARGKKLDIGKSCLRFKKLEDLPLDVVGKVIGSMTMDEFVDYYIRVRSDYAAEKASRKAATGRSRSSGSKSAKPKTLRKK
jgi:hypothetical protein